MRLINADILLEALNGFGDKEHANRHFLYGIESAKELITNAPTVEAIPIEWIKKYMKHLGNTKQYGSLEEISYMLEEWEWEQEDEAD